MTADDAEDFIERIQENFGVYEYVTPEFIEDLQARIDRVSDCNSDGHESSPSPT